MYDNDDKKAEITTWDEVHLFTRNNVKDFSLPYIILG